MFGISEKLRDAAAAGGLFAVTGALALVGVVWLTIAGVSALSLYLAPPLAMLVVGTVLLLPLVVLLARTRAPARQEREPVAEDPASAEIAAISRLAGTAQALANRSPLAGAALALGAAYFASRSPATSALAIQIIAEVIEQWAKSRSDKADDAPSDPSI
jgi:hypothetical protein